MQYMIDKLNQINELGKITTAAWHIKQDDEDINGVRFEDESGRIVEIIIHEPGHFFQQIDCALLNVALRKCFQQNGIDGNRYWIDFICSLSDAVNKARELLPHDGIKWVNEQRAQLYDHVEPEYII